MRECLNNMKKYRIVAVFVMILLMGCGSAQNGKMKESSTMKESEETISIKTYDWNHARIKDMVDMQCFGNGPIVQNENYIFYPKDGYKVARVDKEKKDEKIMESLVLQPKTSLHRDSTQTPIYTVEGVPSGTWWQWKDIERYEDIGRTSAIRNYISHLSLVNRLFLNIDPLLVRL